MVYVSINTAGSSQQKKGNGDGKINLKYWIGWGLLKYMKFTEEIFYLFPKNRSKSHIKSLFLYSVLEIPELVSSFTKQTIHEG
jgi:hypothetical protein